MRHFISSSTVIRAVVALALAVPAVALSWPGHAQAATSDDIVFLRGFAGGGHAKGSSNVDNGCVQTWGPMETYLRQLGWTGGMRTIGYYTGDWQSGNQCDVQLDSKAPGTQHISRCDSYPSTHPLTAADEGTNNQDLRNLSCQIAWYLYNAYSSQGRNVLVVSDSMGGLLIRDVLHQVFLHNSAYPPYLYIPEVVSFAAPNGGIPSPGGAFFACFGCQQGSNMQTNAGEPSTFIDSLMTEGSAPIGSPGVPTEWTQISSSSDSVAGPSTAFNFPNSYIGYPAVHKIQYTEVPGYSPSYAHGQYRYDVSSSPNATALTCDNCGTPTASNSAMYHADRLAFSYLSKATPTPPAFPVVDVAGGGAFFDKWLAMGGAAATLGEPTGAWTAVPGGQQQIFAGGRIEWSSSTGTHEVHGAIGSHYAALGATGSAVGFPTSDEQNAPGGGRENTFAGASCGSGSAILWTSATGAHEMQGCIYDAFIKSFGGSGGAYGYPTSDEQATKGGGGRVNYMSGTSCGSSHGSGLYWSSSTGTWPVHGCIFQKYLSIGEDQSGLGFPTSDEYSVVGGVEQNYSDGNIRDIGGSITVTIGSGSGGCTDYGGSTMTGPNACKGFYTTSVWFSGGGVGLLGQEIWTYANGTVQDSTANYALSGMDTTHAWQLQAYIPNEHSDATHAHYHYCSPGGGCADGYINQQSYTNAWATIGDICTSDGTATIVLADDGGDNYPLEVGADAIRAVRLSYAC